MLGGRLYKIVLPLYYVDIRLQFCKHGLHCPVQRPDDDDVEMTAKRCQHFQLVFIIMCF